MGFSYVEHKQKYLFENGQAKEVNNINAYLYDAPNTFIYSRSKTLCDIPTIGIGNQPIDGGNYLFEKEEMEEFIKQEPKAASLFHPWYGSVEFIHQKPRYCLWLGDCSPKELLQAHCQNDRAVMAAYGFSTKMTESECVAELFKRYSEMGK